MIWKLSCFNALQNRFLFTKRSIFFAHSSDETGQNSSGKEWLSAPVSRNEANTTTTTTTTTTTPSPLTTTTTTTKPVPAIVTTTCSNTLPSQSSHLKPPSRGDQANASSTTPRRGCGGGGQSKANKNPFLFPLIIGNKNGNSRPISPPGTLIGNSRIYGSPVMRRVRRTTPGLNDPALMRKSVSLNNVDSADHSQVQFNNTFTIVFFFFFLNPSLLLSKFYFCFSQPLSLPFYQNWIER